MPMTHHRQQGMSLIELMVSIVIGMIIMAGVLGLSIATFGANATQIRTAQLQYELRKVVDDFARDLRRAGYRPLPADFTSPLGMNLNSQTGPATIEPIDNMTVRYDIDDGADADEYTSFGYRRIVDQKTGVGRVEVAIDGKGWASLTNPQVVDISEFSVMRGVLKDGVGDPEVDSSYAYACDADRTNEILGNVYSVRVTGELVNDGSITRTVVETIRPRNLLVTDCP